MSKRITFDVRDEVYEKLSKHLNTDDSTVSSVVKQFLYSMTGYEIEMSQVEKDRLDRIEEGKKRLAEKEKSLKQSKGIPKNPFNGLDLSGEQAKRVQEVKQSPFVKK